MALEKFLPKPEDLEKFLIPNIYTLFSCYDFSFSDRFIFFQKQRSDEERLFFGSVKGGWRLFEPHENQEVVQIVNCGRNNEVVINRTWRDVKQFYVKQFNSNLQHHLVSQRERIDELERRQRDRELERTESFDFNSQITFLEHEERRERRFAAEDSDWSINDSESESSFDFRR